LHSFNNISSFSANPVFLLDKFMQIGRISYLESQYYDAKGL